MSADKTICLVLIFIVSSSAAFAFTHPAEQVTIALDAYEAGEIAEPAPAVLAASAPRERARWTGAVSQGENPVHENLGCRVHELEAGFETYSYKYEETVEGDHFMDLDGRFNGIFLNYTFRPNQLDPFFSGLVNMFRLELRYAKARLDYTGGVQFSNGDSVPLTLKSVPDRVLEGRGIMGKDIPFMGFIVTPFSGVGIRALKDDASKVTGTYTYGGAEDTISGYKRISHYYYVPFGVDIERGFPGRWRARLSLEYDLLVAGMQESYSPVDIVYNGTTYHYDSIRNRQAKGHGLRASFNIKTELGPFGFFIEPFYRFWDIEDSDWAHFSAGPGYEFVGVAMEPSNVSREVGVKMGMFF